MNCQQRCREPISVQSAKSATRRKKEKTKPILWLGTFGPSNNKTEQNRTEQNGIKTDKPKAPNPKLWTKSQPPPTKKKIKKNRGNWKDGKKKEKLKYESHTFKTEKFERRTKAKFKTANGRKGTCSYSFVCVFESVTSWTRQFCWLESCRLLFLCFSPSRTCSLDGVIFLVI